MQGLITSPKESQRTNSIEHSFSMQSTKCRLSRIVYTHKNKGIGITYNFSTHFGMAQYGMAIPVLSHVSIVVDIG